MITVRGPNVFLGYWRQPDKTRSELHAEGFFTTGDLGRQDSDGYISIVGRGKELVITGGLWSSIRAKWKPRSMPCRA